jgi:diguanylate cyclase
VIYPESQSEAAKIADQALKELNAEGVAPNPQNYVIWFEYLTGRNSALVRYIERAREKKFKLTAERHNEIYTKFFAGGLDSSMPEGWTEKIELAASQIVQALDSAGAGTEKYGAALTAISGNLNSVESKSEISALVSNILSETNTMNGEIRSLQGQIEESQAEVNELRVQLATTQQDAVTDRLTTLANRRGFDQALEELTAEARIELTPLCLIIADIDFFKQFNDTHGHQIGDQVLRLVGRTLDDGTKGRDFAARYGGEEFAIILPDTPLEGASILAEHLRKTLESRKLARKGSSEGFGAITMSFGVTQYVSGETLEALVARADKLLYKAKELGRNRVAASIQDPDLKKSA